VELPHQAPPALARCFVFAVSFHGGLLILAGLVILAFFAFRRSRRDTFQAPIRSHTPTP
jgi:hypothetical protein